MNNRVKKPRSILALLIVTVMILTMGIPLQSVFAQATLSDIDGHWANKVISAWVDEGLASGYPDGTFKPNSSITRAEFTVLVNRLFKFEETAPVTFSDVNEKDWFYSDIGKAVKAGYIKGFEDGTVKPGNNISRQEVATIIASLKSLQASASDADHFADAAAMPAWSKGWIGAVSKAGFMNGFPDGNFGFAKNLTRAEAVVALNNLRRIKIEAIADQTIKVDATSKVAAKALPADATLSVKSSDEAVVKAAIVGSDVELKGVKVGTATVTVTAKKGALPDVTATFKVTVEAATVYSGGGGGGYIPPANTAPVITVVEPDGVNDGIITLAQGAAFVRPTVTARDAENGDITTRIVQVGENLVNTSVIGEYLLTYNVTDLQNLAATEKRVTVKVVAAVVPAYRVDILESVVPGEKQVYVTITDGSDGSLWKVFVKKGSGRVELTYNSEKNRFEGSTLVADASAANVTFERKPVVPVVLPAYTVNILESVVPGEKQVYVTITDGSDGSLWKVFVKKGSGRVELTYNSEKHRFEGSTLVADASAANVTFEKKEIAPVVLPAYTVNILESVVPGEKQVYATITDGSNGALWKVFVKKGSGRVELIYNSEKNRFEGSTLVADANAANITFELKQTVQ